MPKGMLLDLNAEPALEEEQSSITSSCSTLPTSSSSAFGETLRLFGHHVEPSRVSSTVDNNSINLCRNLSNKRKCGNQDVEEQRKTFCYGGESHENTSKQQVEGACKDGNIVTRIHESSEIQLREAKKTSMEMGKDLLDDQHKDSHRAESTHEEAPSKFFSVLNWKYVILEPETEMSNVKNDASVKIHDQRDLFEYLNRYMHIANPRDNFWIKKSQESTFFDYFKFKDPHTSYPKDIKKDQRYSATQEIMLNIYYKRINLQGSLVFVGEIQSLSKLHAKLKRINRIRNILKISTVFFVMYLSMFGEHEGERLREEQIISFMKFIEEFLHELAKKETFVSNFEDSIEEYWYNLLHLDDTKDKNSSQTISTAWKTVEYWMEKKKNVLPLNGSPGARYNYKSCIHFIIMKILFFSNKKLIYQTIEKKKKHARFHRLS
jgi:nitrate reductase NapAB chaperone NapD